MSKRYVRFREQETQTVRYGLVRDDSIVPLKAEPWVQQDIVENNTISFNNVRVLPPVSPSKIVCVGLNYHAHVRASFSADKAPERPLLFLKPPSSIIGHQDAIVHPEVSERVDYEAELGVVIGREASHIREDKAKHYIFGFTCINDVTARDLQKVDGQWTRAKGFDTFCPVGPEIVTGIDWQDILVEGILNGTVMQSGRTSHMIFPIPFLISYISSIMTLYPGDLISTGTPAGISPMKPGDTIVVRIEQVGELANHVAASKQQQT